MTASRNLTDRRIRLTLAYDGTDYCGWQIQAGDRTVQGVLEEALETMHRRRVTTTASGRTDSGVHARGQVVHFDTDITSLPVEKIPPALNALMPRDVRILDAALEAPDFHARHDARIRIYHYYLRPAPDPLGGRFSWPLDHRPSLVKLNAMASRLVGTHDFTAFTAAGDPSSSKVRRVLSSAFFIRGPHLVYRVAGTAFLWRMVRSLVGTMVSLERVGAGAEQLQRILEGRERAAAGTTAPGAGLFLEKVLYDADHPY